MTREGFINRDKQHGTASHRRAPKQERELAKRSRGKLVPGSGSKAQKGDVSKAFGVFRLEAKTTRNNSFSVTREMVRKIEDAALYNGEIPAIVIEFIDDAGKPCMEVAVVPTYLLPQIGADHAK